jgi:hypothetical protein
MKLGVIIGSFHLTLLGWINMMILVQYHMIGIFRSSFLLQIGASVFLTGFLLNELILFLQCLMERTYLLVLPFAHVGLLLASIILTIGILLICFKVKTEHHLNMR